MKAIRNNRLTGIQRAFVIVAAAPLLQPLSAAAQSESGLPEAIRECQSLPDNFARLACYDAALPPGQAPDTAAQGRQNQREQAQQATNQQAQSPPQQAQQAQARQAQAQRAQAAPAAPARQAQTESRRVQSTTAAAADDSLAEAVSIVEMRMLRSGTNARFFTSDGRVFAQISGRSRPDWPDTPFEAQLESSRLGGTYLRIRSIDRRVRVALRE